MKTTLPAPSAQSAFAAHRAAIAFTLPDPVLIADRYTVASVPTPPHIRDLYAPEGGGVAWFSVKWVRADNGAPGECSVELYYRLACYPIPVAFGRNGCDGGELRFETGWRAAGPGKRECRVELTDFDGESCLPKSVCAVLRALGFTVPDDCLASPL